MSESNSIQSGSKAFREKRAKEMIALFFAGKTQAEIGKLYGLTRAGVSLVLLKFGVTGDDAGWRAVAYEKRKNKLAAAEKKSIDRFGLTLAERRVYQKAGMSKRFFEQRRNARVRGIGWNLSMGEWGKIWIDSGKWDFRGRGNGKYVMARHLDMGAYEPGNVSIKLGTENLSEGHVFRGTGNTCKLKLEVV